MSAPLFGGAMSCRIPAGFQDVSAVRDVPDNQEVFVDDVERVLSVEVMEHDQDSGEDVFLVAAFEDLARANECRDAAVLTQVPTVAPDVAPGLLLRGGVRATRVGWVAGTLQGVVKFREHAQDTVGNSVRVWLAVARLPAQFHADVLLSLTDPAFVSPASSSATKSLPPQAPDVAEAMFFAALHSLEIHDAGLFA